MPNPPYSRFMEALSQRPWLLLVPIATLPPIDIIAYVVVNALAR